MVKLKDRFIFVSFSLHRYLDGCSSAFTLYLPGHSLSTFSIQLLKNATNVTDCSIKVKFSTPEGAFVLVDVFFIRRQFGRPKFDLTEYQVYISEELPLDGSIQQINVINRTPSEMSEVFFTLVAEDYNSGMFTISETGEIKLVKALDYEKTTEYFVAVIAYDKTQDVSSETTPVRIIIINKNDNRPVIEKQIYDVAVSESLASGSDILRLSATDADAEGGSYGVDIRTIVFEIVSRNDSDRFTLNTTTGVLVLSMGKKLDYDSGNTVFQLVVRALNPTDNLASSTNSTITIRVYNVNEHAPTFTQTEYQWSVIENSISANFSSISATDSDAGNVIQYSVQSSSNNLINIDPNTGLVTLVRSFDYEVEKEYVFQISASDGQLTSTANLRVTVVNVNDNLPYFKETSASLQVFPFPYVIYPII